MSGCQSRKFVGGARGQSGNPPPNRVCRLALIRDYWRALRAPRRTSTTAHGQPRSAHPLPIRAAWKRASGKTQRGRSRAAMVDRVFRQRSIPALHHIAHHCLPDLKLFVLAKTFQGENSLLRSRLNSSGPHLQFPTGTQHLGERAARLVKAWRRHFMPASLGVAGAVYGPCVLVLPTSGIHDFLSAVKSCLTEVQEGNRERFGFYARAGMNRVKCSGTRW